MKIRRIIADARSLQDPDYSFRGVGQHGSSLISGLRYRDWKGTRPHLIGLVSKGLPDLPPTYSRLFDEIKTTAGISTRQGDCFVCLSPMTHDPTWLEPILRSDCEKVALVYDFIPLQYPRRYLNNFKHRSQYIACLSWLGRYDCYASISAASLADCRTYVAHSQATGFVTGVALRDALWPDDQRDEIDFVARSYLLVAGGGDSRKNVECALTAHALIARQGGHETSIRVSGHYPEPMKKELRERYLAQGGQAERLRFVNHVDDKTLQAVYAGAFVTIVPSIAEGFSIPIIESLAAGTPALVSDIPAHRELIQDDGARFDPKSPDELAKILLHLSTPENWRKVLADQKDVWTRFVPQSVVDRFVDGLQKTLVARQASPIKPIAREKRGMMMLSPLPPSESGVADFSAATMAAIGQRVSLDVYTSTANAETSPSYARLRGTSEFKRDRNRGGPAVFVLGNSHFHLEEFELLLECGGSVILHDARMIDFYVHLCGIERAAALASRELKRTIAHEQVYEWMHYPQILPTLFYLEILEAADKVFTHSHMTADLVRDRYGVEAIVLPFAQYKGLSRLTDSKERRRQVRMRYGWNAEHIVIGTFGQVHDNKAPDELIWALRLLHDWNINAKLIFVGAVPFPQLRDRLEKLIRECKLDDSVILLEKTVNEDEYISLLYSVDIGIQLRTYFMGGLSGGLNDCIAAYLPSIANEHLAMAMDAPSFVRRVPDSLSPLLLAEAVLEIIEAGEHRTRPSEAGRFYAESHSPEAYAKTLVEHLEVGNEGR